MLKTCTTCKVAKLATEFRKQKSRRDGVQSVCKVCARAYHKSAYMTKYGEKTKARSKIRFESTKSWLDGFKARAGGCAVCDEQERVCLVFHHKDPSTKSFTIGSGQNRKLDLIKEEVRKCAVICANCHAKVHAGLIVMEG